MKNIFLGLGTNLGDREKNLAGAQEAIALRIGKILSASGVYETEPWGFMSDQKFLNQVVKVESNLSPLPLLNLIHEIESDLGRVRQGVQYSSRVIDIDILLYDDIVFKHDLLQIPHPLMPERKFVLVPLCEIEPGIVHPARKVTIKELLESCKDNSLIRKL